MTDHVIRKLNFPRKLLLWTAACLAIALPIAFGLLNATPSSRASGNSPLRPSSSSVSDQASPESKATAW